MPPRIPILNRLLPQEISNSSHSFSLPIRPFSSTPVPLKTATKERPKFRDPYAVAQARARKAANLSKQAALKEQRALALGDPVRGITTPFVESFDKVEPTGDVSAHLKHFLSVTDIEQAREGSEQLSAPLAEPERPEVDGLLQSTSQEAGRRAARERATQEEQKRLEQNRIAQEAIQRIVDLNTGNSKDRTRVNIQRCIAHFGRHNTDETLPPKPTARLPNGEEQPAERKERAGPDTGSSEVQVAILTAKIRVLADFLANRGKGDKVNKRNLRLLVHRRQKHLKYLRKKERGGPRWTNLIETLGLTEGTWKGEISL